MLELIETVAVRRCTVGELYRFYPRAFEKACNPCLDRDIKLDPFAVDEQRYFPNTDRAKPDRAAALPAIIKICPRRGPQVVVAVAPQGLG